MSSEKTKNKKEVKLKEETLQKTENIEAVERDERKKLRELYEDSVKDLINTKEEDNETLRPILQRIATRNNSALMAFIAPSFSKRISPTETRSASIRIWEELGIDKTIEDIRNKLVKSTKPNLMLLINSPGGYLSSSYIVANMIRDNFEKIIVFVPHIAASGGTIVVLIGNEIVMGQMSRLSPIDTQVFYKGEVVSAQSMRRAIRTCDKYFEKISPGEAPYPRKIMAEKFDPVLFEEWDAELNQIYYYARKLLKRLDIDPTKPKM